MLVYYSQDIREEELKNRVATEWFSSFDTTQIVGNIDFCVCTNNQGNTVSQARGLYTRAGTPTPRQKTRSESATLSQTTHIPPLDGDKETVPTFEGVGGVSRDAGGSPAITGNESVSLSKTQSVLHSAETSRITTVQTPFVAGETSANPTTESKSASLLQTLLWGEAKAGIRHSLYHSLVQLILTIGKARTFDKHLPPLYLTAFDAAEIAFLPYHTIQPVFYQNDFNWNVRPSDHNSKEFLQLLELVEKTLKDHALVFNFAQDSKALKEWIKSNLNKPNAQTIQKVQINKNNFTFVYQRWCEEVKDSIQIYWDGVIKAGLMDADFFLADLLSDNNTSILESLYVLLQSDHYQFDRHVDAMGIFSSKEVRFKDKMQAHRSFWNKYERPPKEIYWNYIVERRDLLVPQDIRERKGSFFTPQQWVELSQQYLADTLGENWQDEYYIWDCCAGTGNLLNGLTNKRNIWASTLDRADVDVMHQRIQHGANLLDTHVFQFDFLNDKLLPLSDLDNNGKLPIDLYEVISDPHKRKKLIIYINPPYAEAGDAKQPSGTGHSKSKVATDNATYRKYKGIIGKASNELFAQFFIRVYKEIPGCTLAEFSKLKILQASNFATFRTKFKAKLLKSFAVPANSFDNVKGRFPIGFFIWDTAEHDNNTKKTTFIDLYNTNNEFITRKEIYTPKDVEIKRMNEWLLSYKKAEKGDSPLGILMTDSPDFQHNNHVSIVTEIGKGHLIYKPIEKNNLLPICIYFAVRFSVKATWMNDRDQFLFPNDQWEKDRDFQFNCLVYTLFHNQNRIRDGKRINHWIPFFEDEMDLKKGLRSHFMQEYIRDFLNGKISIANQKQHEGYTNDKNLFTSAKPNKQTQTSFIAGETPANQSISASETPANPISGNESVPFPKTTTGDESVSLSKTHSVLTPSPQAQAVLDAGREVYRYYHQTWQERGGGSPDASLYDIKEYFKGRNEDGKMNNKSDDATFNELMERLRATMQDLAEAIEPKVYEYGFLK